MESNHQEKSIEQKRINTHKKIVKWLWALMIVGMLSGVLAFFLLSYSDLPSIEELENPKSELASEVYAADGQVLGRYYTENRVPVSFEDLSPHLVRALVATEDERFFEHSGIDSEALGRVLVKTAILRQRNAGGGSTITQQLAKLLFSDRNFRGMNKLEKIIGLVERKFKEWIIAVRLERRYTKEEIMAMYLNKFSFLYDAYGIKAAAETYFGKPQSELNITEAATLIGMLKNPSLFNPLKRPDTTLHRRMVVLKQMQKNGVLTQEEYDTLRVQPLSLNFSRQTHTDGLAPYFRMELRKEIDRILKRDESLKTDGEKYDKFRDGLKIYTTIDPIIQRHAEAAMLEHMKKLQKIFDRHWKGKDPWTYESGSEHEIAVEVRQSNLRRLIRETGRYEKLRSKYLTSIINKMEKEIDGVRIRDVDIDRILDENEQRGAIAKLVSRKMISANLAAKYRKILKNENFPTLEKQWRRLQTAVRAAFDSPVKMRVFTYDNKKLEKDTTMSPLDSIKYHRMFLQIGSMSVDPVTGQVKSWVGGINHKYFQFDHVNSSVNRQVGSTFKPFIYATAIALQGISPCFEVIDIPQTILPYEGNFRLLKEWTPRNSSGNYTGQRYTLKEGLRQSKNTVSVYLMKQLGDTKPVRGLVHNMGIDSTKKYSNGRPRVPRQPSICLGATDLSVYEMTGAYTTFANNGLYNKPIFISRIEDKNGRLIYQEFPEEHLALNPNPNYVMVEMLKYAAGGMGLKSDIGGKTGTTNDYVDGWFMGITPSLVVGTWVGGEDRWVRFRTITYGQGARMAKPFCQKFIERLEKDEKANYNYKKRFRRPPGDLGIVINCGEYQNDMQEDDPNEDPFGDEDVFDEDPFGEEGEDF